MIDERATLTAADAQRYLGIPASSIRRWANPRPGETPRIHPVGINHRGAKLYPAITLTELAHTTTRRSPHSRPNRRTCGAGTVGIACDITPTG